MARTLAVAAGFLVVAVLLGRFLVPRLFDVVVRMRVRYVLLVFAVAFALGLSALAALAGSALIIGAFAAGLILSGTNQFDTIEHEVRPVASVFTPIFFVSVGASVNLRLLDPTSPAARGTLASPARSSLIAIVGKIAAGWAAPWVRDAAAGRRASGWCRAARSGSSSPTSAAGRACSATEVFGAVLLDGHGDDLRRAARRSRRCSAARRSRA